jgi:hypothetical protein
VAALIDNIGCELATFSRNLPITALTEALHSIQPEHVAMSLDALALRVLQQYALMGLFHAVDQLHGTMEHLVVQMHDEQPLAGRMVDRLAHLAIVGANLTQRKHVVANQ